MTDADTKTSTLPRRLSALALGLALVAATGHASAEERDPAAAEVLFREGKQLMAEGSFERACPKLAESYRLDPATGALLATALCYERAGKFATAWAAYTDAAGRARSEGAADREQSARAKAAELEPKLDRLVINVAAPETPGLRVTRDGLVIGQAEWGTSIPVDPGSHVVEATATGKSPFRSAVTVQGAATGRVNVPELRDVLRDEAGTGAGMPPSEGTPPSTEVAAEGSHYWTPLRVTGVAVGAAGVAGIVVGAIFGAKALSLNSDSNAEGRCKSNNDCNPEGTRLRNDARRAGNVSTFAMIAGAALTAGGVVLFTVGAPSDPAVGLWVSPPVAGRGDLVLRARF
jgi:hypothetical protein